MEDINIRRAQKEDAFDIIQLVKQVISEVGYFPSSADEFNYTTEQEEEFIENAELVLVATVNNKIVGASTLIRGNYNKTSHVANFGITLLQEYSNRGIGSKVVETVIEHVKNVGIKKIELEVFENNLPAIQLYKKYGFICEGIKNNAIMDNAKFFNILLMAKFF